MPELPLPDLSHVAAGLQDRLVLLLNHLLRQETAATERLRPLAGQQIRVQIDGQPAWAPQLPPLHLGVTPAGMFERLEASQPNLTIAVDGSNPLGSALAMLKGERRGVTVSGETEMAAAVNWLFENLRWDLGDELSRLVGNGPAHLLEQAAAQVRAALGKLLAPNAPRG